MSGSEFSDEYITTVVRQATAMVSVQLGRDLDEALDRLKIRAMMLNETVERTALDVLDRVISFDASPPSVTGPNEQDFWPSSYQGVRAGVAVYSHPYGPLPDPWYVVGNALVFRAHDHPDGPSSLPCFRLLDGQAYATRHHTAGASDLPWYDVRGSMVYPAAGHPEGVSDTPWYQAR